MAVVSLLGEVRISRFSGTHLRVVGWWRLGDRVSRAGDGEQGCRRDRPPRQSSTSLSAKVADGGSRVPELTTQARPQTSASGGLVVWSRSSRRVARMSVTRTVDGS